MGRSHGPNLSLLEHTAITPPLKSSYLLVVAILEIFLKMSISKNARYSTSQPAECDCPPLVAGSATATLAYHRLRLRGIRFAGASALALYLPHHRLPFPFNIVFPSSNFATRRIVFPSPSSITSSQQDSRLCHASSPSQHRCNRIITEYAQHHLSIGCE